jgi:hypothetical protein
MKRRKFLIALGVVPPLVVSSCGKDEFPSTPTVITGKVVDINDKPVEGIGLSFGGGYRKGLSIIPTFDVRVKTNKDGIYRIEKVVPDGTDDASFLPDGIPPLSDIYLWKDNKYIIASGVGPIVYGETNTFNFQLRQR